MPDQRSSKTGAQPPRLVEEIERLLVAAGLSSSEAKAAVRCLMHEAVSRGKARRFRDSSETQEDFARKMAEYEDKKVANRVSQIGALNVFICVTGGGLAFRTGKPSTLHDVAAIRVLVNIQAVKSGDQRV
jgi:hypothetical protein